MKFCLGRWFSGTVLSLLLLLWGMSPAVYALAQGDQVPHFALPTVGGQEVALQDLQGRPVLLKLATTWCPTCKQQMQEIQAAQDVLQQHNVVVAEVYLQGSRAGVKEFASQHPLATHRVVWLDDGTVRRRYAVYVIPQLLLLDAKGEVVYTGHLTPAHVLREKVKNRLP